MHLLSSPPFTCDICFLPVWDIQQKTFVSVSWQSNERTAHSFGLVGEPFDLLTEQAGMWKSFGGFFTGKQYTPSNCKYPVSLLAFVKRGAQDNNDIPSELRKVRDLWRKGGIEKRTKGKLCDRIGDRRNKWLMRWWYTAKEMVVGFNRFEWFLFVFPFVSFRFIVFLKLPLILQSGKCRRFSSLPPPF